MEQIGRCARRRLRDVVRRTAVSTSWSGSDRAFLRRLPGEGVSRAAVPRIACLGHKFVLGERGFLSRAVTTRIERSRGRKKDPNPVGSHVRASEPGHSAHPQVARSGIRADFVLSSSKIAVRRGGRVPVGRRGAAGALGAWSPEGVACQCDKAEPRGSD